MHLQPTIFSFFNLPTKFCLGKINTLHFFKSLTQYEVCCIKNTSWYDTSVSANFIWKWCLVCKLHNSHVNRVMNVLSSFIKGCHGLNFKFKSFRDFLLILLDILSEFKRINQLLFPLKLPENGRFFDDFLGNRSSLICLNLLNIRSGIWEDSLAISNSFSS